jgi:hypothetical protein
MQKTLKLLSFLCLAVLLSSGCNKDTQNPTALQITVLNAANDAVGGASISIYKTQTDLANNTNIQDIQYTDSRGSATFDNLSPIVYYYNIYRSSDCSNNAFSTSKTGSLSPGQINTVTVHVDQVGQLTFNNTSGDAYDVTINGTLWRHTAAHSSASMAAKVGTYAVHVKQVTGVTGTAVEKDYNPSVTSCGTQTVSFP